MRIAVFIFFLIFATRSFAHSHVKVDEIHGNKVFSGTYRTVNITSGEPMPDIYEDVYRNDTNYIMTRYKKTGSEEKFLLCKFDAVTDELVYAKVERKKNSKTFQTVEFNTDENKVKLITSGESSGILELKKKKGFSYTVPDAIHVSLSRWILKKDESKNLYIIDWSGKHHGFQLKSKGIREDESGTRYSEVVLLAVLPENILRLLGWYNSFFISEENPRCQLMFHGKQGPFAPEVKIWLEGKWDPHIEK